MTDAFGRPYPLDWVLAGVGPGWSKILQRLIRDLFLLEWDGSVHQVKEKFGGLRFYIGGGSDAIFARIDQAERESYKTCELCGEPGKRTHHGWIRVECETHEALSRMKDFESRSGIEVRPPTTGKLTAVTLAVLLLVGCASAPTVGPCVMTSCGYECCNNDGKVCECRTHGSIPPAETRSGTDGSAQSNERP
jgi:hypothetical protein